MQPHEKIKAYVGLVCEQIRWKKAHPSISEELKNHIVDTMGAYMVDGMDEQSATDQALADTGDAAIIGTQLDRTHRPKPQWGMLSLTAVLLLMGVLIKLTLLSADFAIPNMASQLVAMSLGAGLMLVAYFCDFTIISKYPRALYLCLCVVTWFLIVASPRLNGKALYLNLTYMVYLPIALLFPTAIAGIVYCTRGKGYLGLIASGISVAVSAFIALMIPAFGEALLIIAAGFVLLSVAIIKNWFGIKRLYGFLVMLSPCVIILLVAAYYLSTYHLHRISAVFNPNLDPYGSGYWTLMLRSLISGSNWIGAGQSDYAGLLNVGNSPDYLLTYLIFNFGWIVFVAIMAVVLFFIVKGFMLCLKQKSGLGLFVSLAVMLTFTIQTIGYVFANLGFNFCAPISLPLISYGSGAMMMNMLLIGLMLSVFRTGDIVRDKAVAQMHSDFITWNEGKLIISFDGLLFKSRKDASSHSKIV